MSTDAVIQPVVFVVYRELHRGLTTFLGRCLPMLVIPETLNDHVPT